jgi:hypothetical protein
MITNALEESTGKLVFQKDPHKPGEDGIKMLMQVHTGYLLRNCAMPASR